MTKTRWIKTLLMVPLVACCLSSAQHTEAQNAAEAVRIAGAKIGDKDAMVRAQAVRDLARANNKDGTAFIMTCIAAENDGEAGWAMTVAMQQLTSKEALDEIEKNVLKWTKPENLFGAYWTLLALAHQRSEGADAILRKSVESRDRDVYLRSAAIEAIAEARRADLADMLLTVLKTYDAKWDANPILALACIHGAPKVVNVNDRDMRNNVVLALADVLEKTKDDRIQWFTTQALSRITGEETYTDPAFWRFWVQMGGNKADKGHDGPTSSGRDVPQFFKSGAVGKRIVFAIDVSGSMSGPVSLTPEMRNPPPPAEEPKGPVTGGGKGRGGNEADARKAPPPPPDYSKVRTKMDLAKVELIHALEHLPEDYMFNIVLYHTPHLFIDNSTKEFVKATRANKAKFIKMVEGLQPLELTNIYGGLVRSYCINEKKSLDPMKINQRENNPAWDPECLRSGATTIFFLTDGSPTVTDDSIADVRGGRMAQGQARYCAYPTIVADVKRMNVFRKVVIHTIGIGPHDGRLMGALAALTGGEYVDRSGDARGG